MINKLYKNLILECIDKGTIYYHEKRGTSLLQIFSKHIIISPDYYPLLTTRKFNPNISVAEVIWILSGENNIKWLSTKTKIWNNFVSFDKGQETYGYRLISKSINQIEQILNNFKNNSNSKQQYFTYWEPSDLKNGNIFKNIPCILGGVFINKNNKLSLDLFIRSSDIIYGLPYDILTHFLLLKIISNTLNLKMGNLYINISNAHIYSKYIEENLFIGLNNKEFLKEPETKINYYNIKNDIENSYNILCKEFNTFPPSKIKLNSNISEK